MHISHLIVIINKDLFFESYTKTENSVNPISNFIDLDDITSIQRNSDDFGLYKSFCRSESNK
jgi:hypothetical protein